MKFIHSFFDCIFILHNQIQNILCKGDDNAAEKGQKSVCSLGCVVRFERQANLHHAKAQQNKTDCLDCRKDKIGQTIDGCEWISGEHRVCRKC